MSLQEVRANSDVVRQAEGASNGAHRGHEQARVYKDQQLTRARDNGSDLGKDALTIPRCAALPPTPSPNNFKTEPTREKVTHYRKDIDGLRALAAVPAPVLFHAGVGPFSGGFTGVDVFFVISGYLITSLIVGEIRQGRFSIIQFYERRVRRIFPALIAVLIFASAASWRLLLPQQLDDFAESVVATTLFVSNVLFWRESGYFTAPAIEKPLLHTWSLAVEIQFYIAFPLFLFIVHRWLKGRWVTWLVLLTLVSLAVNIFWTG